MSVSRNSSFGSDDGSRTAAAKEFAMLALGGVTEQREDIQAPAEQKGKLKVRAKQLVGLLKRRSSSAMSSQASSAQNSPENSWKSAGDQTIQTEFFEG